MTPDTAAPAKTDCKRGCPRIPLSRKKRFAFWLLLAGGTYLTVELISLCAIYFAFGGWAAVQSIAENDAEPDAMGTGFNNPDEIVHPYLGWVRSPRPNAREAAQDTEVNDVKDSI